MNKRGWSLIVLGSVLIFISVGWLIFNEADDKRAGELAADLLQRSEEIINANSKSETNADEPSKPVEAVEIDGHEVLGIIEVSSINKKLPVFAQYEHKLLKTAPCRYSGEVIEGIPDRLIIAAHNYESHFKELEKVTIGAEVIFTTVSGVRNVYIVTEKTTIGAYAHDELESGDWDLSLFTCTRNGKMRVLVRCVAASDDVG